MKPTLRVLYFEAGSGHMTAARGLVGPLRERLPGWDVDVLDIVEVFDAHPRYGRTMRKGVDDFNDQLQREEVFDLRGRVNLGILFNDWVHWRGTKRLASYWERHGAPHLLVSVTPMYNPAVCASLRQIRPEAGYVTIPVDFEEFKKRYWFTPSKIQQTYLCATQRLREQALDRGVPAGDVHAIGGMVIGPDFYGEPPDRAEALEALGLDPELPLGVAHFGAQGSIILAEIARAIDGYDGPLQMLYLCGRHEGVRAQIEGMSTRHERRVMGFTEEAPHHYYHLADVLIGKPGAMTITEALITHTPSLLIKSTGMDPVQRGNERWVERRGVGRVVQEPAGLPDALDYALERGRASLEEALEREHHRGVFDAADLIAARAAELAPSP